MASEETQTSQTAEEQKTFTQEEVDDIIKKRLARAKSDVPADYEELKSKAQYECLCNSYRLHEPLWCRG